MMPAAISTIRSKKRRTGPFLWDRISAVAATRKHPVGTISKAYKIRIMKIMFAFALAPYLHQMHLRAHAATKRYASLRSSPFPRG
jgi:hypothetical protein